MVAGAFASIRYMKKLLKILTTVCLVIPFVTLVSCGSHGGGGSDSEFDLGGAADVSIDARPSSLDTGDRVAVFIRLSDVHKDGIQLKIRFSPELSYVEKSAELSSSSDTENSRSITPDFSGAIEDQNFLMFRLPRKFFDDDRRGQVTLELVAVDTSDKATIGIDPDVNSEGTFDPALPEFASEAETDVEITK